MQQRVRSPITSIPFNNGSPLLNITLSLIILIGVMRMEKHAPDHLVPPAMIIYIAMEMILAMEQAIAFTQEIHVE